MVIINNFGWIYTVRMKEAAYFDSVKLLIY